MFDVYPPTLDMVITINHILCNSLQQSGVKVYIVIIEERLALNSQSKQAIVKVSNIFWKGHDTYLIISGYPTDSPHQLI